MIARSLDVDDVASALAFGQAQGRVDPGKRTAISQGGATWLDFDTATQAYGLPVTSFRIPRARGSGLRDPIFTREKSYCPEVAAEESDAHLVSRCRTGEAEAWNEFVERFSRYVYAICGRGFRLRDQDAEDVFQEVFARAFEKLSDLRSDDAVRPWLAQLTRRLCIDRLRLLDRDTPSETEPDESKTDDVLSTLDEAMTVRAALDKVGDPCREILDRFFCRDESYQTIGGALAIPEGTIASRISRCLEKVRAAMEGGGTLARREE